MRVALNKKDAGFTDVLYVTSDTDPGFDINKEVNIYGLMEGMNVAPDAQGNEETLPRISLSLMSAK